jgi:NAD(P)-dependent dehydrogenase (short-subunit alcohol dehydrogenase family)
MGIRSIVDDALEISVVGSFTSVGFELRRRLFGWSDPLPDALAGRSVVLTGPTSGLGRAAADALAALGASLVLVGRSEERLAAVRDALPGGGGRHRTVVADMSSLDSVRRAVAQIQESGVRVDILVDNAGAIYPERIEGPDGIEATLATLVVGPFVLVGGLLPLLRESGDARVIAVTSGGMYTQRLDLDDLQSRHGSFSGPLAYARAKRAQVALAREWARRLASSGIAVNAMHPGWADTPGLEEALPAFHGLMRPLLRTPAQGIDTLLWLAAADEAARMTGRLFLDRRPRPFDRVPATRLSQADRRRLWGAVVELSGGADPAPEP